MSQEPFRIEPYIEDAKKTPGGHCILAGPVTACTQRPHA